MILCPWCKRLITPEETNMAELEGIVRVEKCPECRLVISKQLTKKNKSKRKFYSLKRLIEDYKPIKSIVNHKGRTEIQEEVGKEIRPSGK